MNDYVDIHCCSADQGKNIFMDWISRGVGIRGASGAFHPLPPYGTIKVKNVAVDATLAEE